MKSFAAKTLMYLLRLIGLKRLLRLGWSKILYPELKKLSDKSEDGWDDKLLKFVNENIYRVIDLL